MDCDAMELTIATMLEADIIQENAHHVIPGEIGDSSLISLCPHLGPERIIAEQRFQGKGKAIDIICLDDDRPFPLLNGLPLCVLHFKYF